MRRSVRGRLVALGALLAVAVAFPAASSSAKKPRFKVVSAKATATLTFPHLETTESLSNGTVTLVVTRKKVGRGTLPGRLLFPIKGTIDERVQTQQLIPGTPEYNELN